MLATITRIANALFFIDLPRSILSIFDIEPHCHYQSDKRYRIGYYENLVLDGYAVEKPEEDAHEELQEHEEAHVLYGLGPVDLKDLGHESKHCQ